MRNGRAGKTVWAVLATVVRRRGRIVVPYRVPGVAFVRTVVRVRGVTLRRDLAVRARDRVASPRRRAARNGTRRHAGREISDSECAGDIARRAGFPPAQPPENAQSTIHGADSLLVTLGRHPTRDKCASYNRAVRRRNALPTTDTEDRLIAKLAMTGDSNKPSAG